MEKPERTRTIRAVKAEHASYLIRIAESEHELALRSRFRNVQRKLQNLLRKTEGSINSLKGVPKLARLLFGLHEDLPRLRLPTLSFDGETEAVNRLIIAALKKRLASNYSGECGSHGEALLNCFLDLFITLTVPETPREFEAKPGFLVNPVTGSLLEIDVLLEEFRLGFEFQGEHHYTDSKVQAKDAFKLKAFAKHARILIPVNIVQLQGDELQTLIVNSIKDHLGLHDLLVAKDPRKLKPGFSSYKHLLSFNKATQRIYLSKVLFARSLAWLDCEAKQYIAIMHHRNPISSSRPAPRQTSPAGDLAVTYSYRNLKHVSKAVRQRVS